MLTGESQLSVSWTRWTQIFPSNYIYIFQLSFNVHLRLGLEMTSSLTFFSLYKRILSPKATEWFLFRTFFRLTQLIFNKEYFVLRTSTPWSYGQYVRIVYSIIRGSATFFLNNTAHIKFFPYFYSSSLFCQQPIEHSAKILNTFGFSMSSKKKKSNSYGIQTYLSLKVPDDNAYWFNKYFWHSCVALPSDRI